jgi:UDP-N-acetylglucosamine--N-acetylmuramyl-(pentapeptide) pyrophosphoryl-undecaprenol N-acetylglucosamine transferase
MKIIRKFKPDIVVSTGSYVSVPVVLAGHRCGASVYLHEQNGFPGVSNRMLARFSKKVFLGFDTARDYFDNKSKLVYSGNPVRSEFRDRSREDDRESLGIPQDDLVIMVFGGSLGSETTNELGEAIAREYADRAGYTVIWGTGSMYNEEITERLAAEGFAPANVRISAFIRNMPEVLSASDIVISRSGALSTAETTMVGRAAIFIPSPNVTADHQYYNAKAVADKGGAYIVRETHRTADDVLRIVRSLDADREQIRSMEKASRSIAPVDAADIIYNTIMETYK